MSKMKPTEPTFTVKSHLEQPGTRHSRLVEWAELAQPMSGALSGRTCRIKFHLIDGAVHVGDITYETTEPQPLGHATNRALRDLRLGDVPALAEACLRNMATVGVGMDWLQAFESGRSRAGRSGHSEQTWALVAARRVEAERMAPGKAVRYMVKTWPGTRGATFSSISSATSKVNKAIKHEMLEHGPDGLRLTDKARQYLTTGDDE